MLYNEIETGFAYQFNSEHIVKAIGKNAGWVSVTMLEGDGVPFNVRAAMLDILESNPVVLETPKRRVYRKPVGLRMKINGFKYRVRYLKQDEIITERCMHRLDGSWFKWRPTKAVGDIVADHPELEYIEILSPFYSP